MRVVSALGATGHHFVPSKSLMHQHPTWRNQAAVAVEATVTAAAAVSDDKSGLLNA